MLCRCVIEVIADTLVHDLILQRNGIGTHAVIDAVCHLVAEEAHNGHHQHQHAEIDNIKSSFLFHTGLLRLTAPSGHCIMDETAFRGYIVV